MARFIAVRHENPRLAAPFLTIMQSFNDLEQGLDPPLFSTNLKPRERERSSQRKHVQMVAAVAMEVLMSLGQDDAASRWLLPFRNGRRSRRRPLHRQQFATGETEFAHQLMGAIPSSDKCVITFWGSLAQSRR